MEIRGDSSDGSEESDSYHTSFPLIKIATAVKNRPPQSPVKLSSKPPPKTQSKTVVARPIQRTIKKEHVVQKKKQQQSVSDSNNSDCTSESDENSSDDEVSSCEESSECDETTSNHSSRQTKPLETQSLEAMGSILRMCTVLDSIDKSVVGRHTTAAVNYVAAAQAAAPTLSDSHSNRNDMVAQLANVATNLAEAIKTITSNNLSEVLAMNNVAAAWDVLMPQLENFRKLATDHATKGLKLSEEAVSLHSTHAGLIVQLGNALSCRAAAGREASTGE